MRDPRGGGRASARLTAPSVAAGAVARKWLRAQHGIALRRPHDADRRHRDSVRGLGAHRREPVLRRQRERRRRGSRPTWTSCARPATAAARASTSSPPACRSGWGEPLYDKLDADIAYAMMGINAVKGVEIGAGFRAVTQRGTTHGDELTPEGFVGNNAGGVLGGISTGQDITVSIAIKPTSSIRSPRRSIDLAGSSRPRSRRSVATIRASASARRRSPKRCSRSCSWTTRCGIAPSAATFASPPRRFPPARLEAGRRSGRDGGRAPVRRGVARLFRVRRTVRHLRAAVVPEPGLHHPRDRCADLAAERDPDLRSLRLGLVGRPHRAARGAASPRDRRLAGGVARLLRALRLRLDRDRLRRALPVHGRRRADQRGRARPPRHRRRPSRHRALRARAPVGIDRLHRCRHGERIRPAARGRLALSAALLGVAGAAPGGGLATARAARSGARRRRGAGRARRAARAGRRLVLHRRLPDRARAYRALRLLLARSRKARLRQGSDRPALGDRRRGRGGVVPVPGPLVAALSHARVAGDRRAGIGAALRPHRSVRRPGRCPRRRAAAPRAQLRGAALGLHHPDRALLSRPPARPRPGLVHGARLRRLRGGRRRRRRRPEPALRLRGGVLGGVHRRAVLGARVLAGADPGAARRRRREPERRRPVPGSCRPAPRIRSWSHRARCRHGPVLHSRP